MNTYYLNEQQVKLITSEFQNSKVRKKTPFHFAAEAFSDTNRYFGTSNIWQQKIIIVVFPSYSFQ